jgi:hypothetical protein
MRGFKKLIIYAKIQLDNAKERQINNLYKVGNVREEHTHLANRRTICIHNTPILKTRHQQRIQNGESKQKRGAPIYNHNQPFSTFLQIILDITLRKPFPKRIQVLAQSIIGM